MRQELDDYRDSAAKGTVDFLYRLSDLVKGRSFLHVSAVRYGGGMAEILRRLVPMMAALGVEARWEVLAGDEEFCSCTTGIMKGRQVDLALSLGRGAAAASRVGGPPPFCGAVRRRHVFAARIRERPAGI